jgi:endonuclease YncB( thermonuclease family)
MRGPEKKAKIAFGLACLLAVGLVACGDGTLDQHSRIQPSGPGPSTSSKSDSGTEETTDDDGGAPKPVKPSGCPAPNVVTPDDLPAGFLPAEKVTLIRNVDGDTAHFKFADGERDVRFLYVNTEETHGDTTTQFGLDAASAIANYLNNAQEIMAAPEEDKKNPGKPHLDTYGRTLAVIFVDGDLFETRQVREGWTPYFTEFGCAADPIHSALLYAEAEAKANERGVWEPGHPTDYSAVLKQWIGSSTCRPNPYKNQPYCK